MLTLLEARAPGLRKVGVVSFAIEGLSVNLLPAPPEIPPVDPKDVPGPPPVDPLQDPALYPGGVVPGYTLEDER